MGGHGGLNILPQKKWNVYNFENREKVRKDEEAAAKEEQLKREQSRRRDSEFRLERLRQARGLASAPRPSSPPSSPGRADPGHINLFEGLAGFSALSGAASGSKEADVDERKSWKEEKGMKRKREEKPVVVAPEDEKYRVGYGVAGKGVKAPWYLSRSDWTAGDEEHGNEWGQDDGGQKKKKASGKKTIEELREERWKREKREKERADELLASVRKERHRYFRR